MKKVLTTVILVFTVISAMLGFVFNRIIQVYNVYHKFDNHNATISKTE